MSDNVEFEVVDDQAVSAGPATTVEGLIREEDPILGELRANDGDSPGAKLRTYVFNEIEAVLSGATRGEFLDRLSRIRKAREAKTEKAVKNYPWEKASNIRVPLTLINVQGVYALLKGNFSQREPLWEIKGKSDATKAPGKGLEALVSFAAESKDHTNVREENTTIFYNSVSEGVQIVKVPWVEETYYYRDSESGASIPVIRRDAPAFKPIPNEHFLIRPEWKDFQRAPWVGSVDIYFEHELIGEGTKNRFDMEAVEAVIEKGGDALDSLEVERLESEGQVESGAEDSKRFLCVEMFVFWDLFQDGNFVDVVLTVHPASNTILRAEFNDLRYRPYFYVPYGMRPYSLYKQGVCEGLEGIQAEVDFLHNARIDAIHMELSPMLSVAIGANFGEGEEVRPGKIVRSSDAQKDARYVQINSITDGALEAEMVAQGLGERVSSLSAQQAGFDSNISKSGATASGNMFLAQQGSKVFSSYMEVTKDHYAEGGKILAFQILTHADKAREWIQHLPDELQEDAELALSTIKPEDLPSKFSFSVRTMEMEKTEEARKQALMAAIQLYTAYGQQATQLSMAIYNPQMQLPEEVKSVLQKLLIGQTKLMDEAFENFNQTEGKSYTAYVKDIQLMVEMQEAMKNQSLGGMDNGGQQMGGSPISGSQAAPSGGGGAETVPTLPQGQGPEGFGQGI